MPGSGKSTIGVVLAKTLMMNFCDTDLLIQQSQKRSLCQIIDDEGLSGFIKIENKLVSEISCTNTVVATGGSVILGSDAMANLKRLGTVIYLKVPLIDLKDRIKNIKTRGIVMNPGSSLDEVYAERCPLYSKYADICLDCQNKSLEEIVSLISLEMNNTN